MADKYKSKLLYDNKCEQLAEYFGQGESLTTAELADLASEIQAAVESWFECRAAVAATASRTGDKDDLSPTADVTTESLGT